MSLWDASQDPHVGRLVKVLDTLEAKLEREQDDTIERLDTTRALAGKRRDAEVLEELIGVLDRIALARARICSAAWVAAHPPRKARKRS